jgi:hypothetical protein
VEVIQGKVNSCCGKRFEGILATDMWKLSDRVELEKSSDRLEVGTPSGNLESSNSSYKELIAMKA